MAAITLLGSTFTSVAGAKTVTATPALNDLIVIVVAHTDGTGPLVAAMLADTNGTNTYAVGSGASKDASADEMMVLVRNQLIASAVATDFTFNPDTVTNSGGGLSVYAVSGMTTTGSAAVRQVASQNNQAAGGTPTPVLAAAALTGNALIAAVFNATNPATMTPRGTPVWTERADLGYATPTTGLEVMSINSGETATSIAWGSTSASDFASTVVELSVTATQTLTPSLFTNSQTFYSPIVGQLLVPALFTNSQSFFGATVSIQGLLLPTLHTNSQTFYAATVAATYTLAPSPLTNTSTFFAPHAGKVNLQWRRRRRGLARYYGG